MSAIDVLATLPKTRREVLARLKQRGRATIAELAEELGLTHEGVRAHIVQLQQEGWITAWCPPDDDAAESPTTGRPPVAYCLSVAGDHVFPKHYDDLTVLLLDAVMETADEATLREILAKVTDIRVDALRARGAATLEEKLAAVTSIYLENDPFVEVVQRRDDWVLIERNCPFLNVAMQRPAICSTTVSTLRRLIGYEVVRERRFQDGDARCEFRVLADRPVKRGGKRFEVEPPKESGVRRP
jgi:predicted ArsR family transcriptional regulator